MDDVSYLTREEAAEVLRLTPKGLAQLHHRGDGPPCVRVGRRCLYPRPLLDDWVRFRLEAATHGRATA